VLIRFSKAPLGVFTFKFNERLMIRPRHNTAVSKTLPNPRCPVLLSQTCIALTMQMTVLFRECMPMMSMMAIHLLLLLLQGEMARRMADDVRQRNLALEAELRLSRESERAAKASAALLRNLAPGSSQATNANANSGAVPGAASDTGAAAHQSSPPISTATPTPTSPLVPLRKKPMTSAEVALAFAPTEEDKQREVEAAATAFRADQERLEAEAQRESRFQAAVAEKVRAAHLCHSPK